MANESISFFSKKPVSCPVCDASIYREELRTGRGRLNAGDLTDELRREYVPSKKYGAVYPLVYPVTVCPECGYAAFPQDFDTVSDTVIERIQVSSEERLNALKPIFGWPDFGAPRTLETGCAAYFLAMSCYDHFDTECAPTIKRGLCALRSAWLCNDMHRSRPSENFDYLAAVFYRKARFYYGLAVEREQDGSESIGNAGHLGPDLDKNYGYDGVLYIASLLEFRYGPTSDEAFRRQALDRAKRTVARLFGMGKASKNKPTAILDNARDVYDRISRELGDKDDE